MQACSLNIELGGRGGAHKCQIFAMGVIFADTGTRPKVFSPPERTGRRRACRASSPRPVVNLIFPVVNLFLPVVNPVVNLPYRILGVFDLSDLEVIKYPSIAKDQKRPKCERVGLLLGLLLEEKGLLLEKSGLLLAWDWTLYRPAVCPPVRPRARPPARPTTRPPTCPSAYTLAWPFARQSACPPVCPLARPSARPPSRVGA